MPIVKPAVDFPPPPIDVFPHAEIDTRWLKARFVRPYPYAPPLFDKVKGRMRDETVKGDEREYPFEVVFVGGVPHPKVGTFDLSRDDLENDFSYRDPMQGRSVKGLPKNARKDLHERAVRAAWDMRERALAQQQWLDDLFETAQRADVVDSAGKPPGGPPREFAVHRGWLITRQDYPGGKWTRADRFFEGCSDGLTLRRTGAHHEKNSICGGRGDDAAGTIYSLWSRSRTASFSFLSVSGPFSRKSRSSFISSGLRTCASAPRCTIARKHWSAAS